MKARDVPVDASRARDLREGGAWTRAQSWKNDAIYALVRVALAVVLPLPAVFLRAIGRVLGAIALVIFPAARRTALANVAQALPDLPPATRRRLVARAYVTLGAHLGDAAATLAPGAPLAPLSLGERDRAILADALAEGRGVLFASAHLGPWERVAASLVASGFPLTTLARESYDPRLDALYDRLRGARGVRVIYRGHPGAAARIVRALRTNAVLGAPMDLRSRVPSIDAPFLGRPALTPAGPARIALRTGSAVIVGTAAPSPGGLCVTTTRIPTRDLAADPDGERTLTCRINAELSRRILALPAHWVWMHDRFARDR
jgi:lauroyl/myristoyl acyltransferase